MHIILSSLGYLSIACKSSLLAEEKNQTEPQKSREYNSVRGLDHQGRTQEIELAPGYNVALMNLSRMQ
ncbi:hypothetical protein BVRB_1g013050 [Beta vulgaris subsp. vulgaris]|nr:hypothetical protein BVRB_1g013050 [Beta vulgaris subsp. vulgaris]